MVALQWFSGAVLLAVSHGGRGFIDNTGFYGSFCRGEQGTGFVKMKKIRWTVDNTQTTFLKRCVNDQKYSVEWLISIYSFSWYHT